MPILNFGSGQGVIAKKKEQKRSKTKASKTIINDDRIVGLKGLHPLTLLMPSGGKDTQQIVLRIKQHLENKFRIRLAAVPVKAPGHHFAKTTTKSKREDNDHIMSNNRDPNIDKSAIENEIRESMFLKMEGALNSRFPGPSEPYEISTRDIENYISRVVL